MDDITSHLVQEGKIKQSEVKREEDEEEDELEENICILCFSDKRLNDRRSVHSCIRILNIFSKEVA